MADLGDTLQFSADLYDEPAEDGGVLTNASSVTLTITKPDNTTTAPAVTNPPANVGQYLYDYVTSTSGPSGLYRGVWLFTLASGETVSYVESFDVGSSLVTVDEALAHLRATSTITTAVDLEQLQWLCFVATDAIERDLDRILARRTVIETHDGGKTGIHLRSGPIISLTTVVENGVTLTASDYVLDSTAGILWRGTASAAGWWAYGRQLITVTYVAGYNNPPAAARMVALYLIQAMWQSSQQAPHSLLDEGALDGGNLFAASLLTGLPQPLRNAYASLQSTGTA